MFVNSDFSDLLNLFNVNQDLIDANLLNQTKIRLRATCVIP